MQLKQNKYDLARSGFFIRRKGILWIFFTCGVRISQWQSVDIPFIEHEKWKPNCTFLKLTRTERNTRSMFKQTCYGCQHFKLSQLDHACLTMTDKQLLELHFEDILGDIDEWHILKKWEASVSPLLSPELLQMFKKLRRVSRRHHKRCTNAVASPFGVTETLRMKAAAIYQNMSSPILVFYIP